MYYIKLATRGWGWGGGYCLCKVIGVCHGHPARHRIGIARGFFFENENSLLFS